MIIVEQDQKGEQLGFKVTVREGSGETHHRVTLARSDYMKWTGGKVPADRCVQEAFSFLLEREPKESILSRFDLSVISRYFPEFAKEFPKRLASLAGP